MRRSVLAALLSAAALGLGTSASAAIISFGLNFEFSGGTPPEGTPPWITVTIDDAADAGGANSVRVTISNAGLVDREFASEVSLNLDPALDPTDLTFTPVNTSAVSSVSFLTGENAFKAAGDGHFDILIDFPPPPGQFAAKFSAGETIVFDVTFTSALSADDFDFDSFDSQGNGPGPFKSAAHVQGIGPSNGDSGWIAPVPEPGLALLFAAGALAAARRKRLAQR